MLSKRLQAIYNLVQAGDKVGDIGADHGQLVIALTRHNIVSQAYACDNKQGPFLRLKKAVERAGLTNQIITRLSSGITDLPAFVDTLILAGMGGELIISILSTHLEKLTHIKTLILAPNMLCDEVRRFVTSVGYQIEAEVIVYERHYYEIIRCIKGISRYDELDFTYGPLLRREKSQVFKDKYHQRRAEIERLLELELSDERRDELIKEREGIDQL